MHRRIIARCVPEEAEDTERRIPAAQGCGWNLKGPRATEREPPIPFTVFLHTDVEGFGALAELAPDLRWSCNHCADKIWMELTRTNHATLPRRGGSVGSGFHPVAEVSGGGESISNSQGMRERDQRQTSQQSSEMVSKNSGARKVTKKAGSPHATDR